MSTTIANIKQLVRELELGFWVSDDGTQIAIPYFADGGRRRVDVHVALHEENTFLQFTSVVLFNVQSERARSVLEAANDANHRMRFIKVAYDAENLAVWGYADFWIMDGSMTPTQFQTMLNNFACCLLQAHGRLLDAMDVVQLAPEEVPF